MLIQGKKDLLSRLLFGGPRIGERFLGNGPNGRLTVLAYHRIGSLPGEDYPFQDEIISATPDEFDRQLEFVKTHFNLVNFHQLAEMDKKNEPYPPRPAIITFDDGYADNYSEALPILRSHGLTATIYVSTHFIDAQEPFWFDMLSYYVMRMKAGLLQINRGSIKIDLTDQNRRSVRRDIGRALRVVSDKTRKLILNEPTTDELELVRTMTWDEIRQLDGAGIEIGSHTVSHPFLVQLTDRELRHELAESKERIEEETGTTVSSLSYPSGGSENFDARSVRLARELGYSFAVSYDHKIATVANMDRYAVPRVHVEPDVKLPLFKANMLLPALFVR